MNARFVESDNQKQVVFATRILGESYDQFQIFADGTITKGSGTAAPVDILENLGAVESTLTTVAATGATETLDLSATSFFNVTMDQNCEFTFSNPAVSGNVTMFTLILRGAFTPTWPLSVDWPDGTPPTYTTPSIYTFMTIDGGTTYLGSQAGKAYA